ncbi:MAG TPA: efflux RND transporter periplasmic adaptor subunit [Candidatus Baltobacteraceae bacterium]|nr:efflux RND transporter periplasmic adaptor subunit [Candidatus Baltobacteraceae bacterium]
MSDDAMPAVAQTGAATLTPTRRVPWAALLLVLLALLALAGALVAVRGLSARGAAPATVTASGTIEATESDLAPKVQGRVIALRVRDGDRIRKGQVLAVLERTDPSIDERQARAALDSARAQVDAAQSAYDLQRATYATTLTQAGAGVGVASSRLGQAGENLGIERSATTLAIDQARAQLLSAHAAEAHARTDLARAKALVATGDEAQQVLDDATNAYAAAEAQLRASADALALAQAQRRTVHVRALDVTASRREQTQSVATLRSAEAEAALIDERRAQLAAAQQELAQAQAALARTQDAVRETTLVAPYDGYVVSHDVEAGDLVQPGGAVMTVGDLDHPYVYVYVSETDLPRVKTGAHAGVTLDGVPSRTFDGVVTEIANTAEFTPENVQTKEERMEYLVFRVKVQLTDRTGTLKPGLPVDAAIRI